MTLQQLHRTILHAPLMEAEMKRKRKIRTTVPHAPSAARFRNDLGALVVLARSAPLPEAPVRNLPCPAGYLRIHENEIASAWGHTAGIQALRLMLQ